MGRDTNGDGKRAGPQCGGAALSLRDRARRLIVFLVGPSSVLVCTQFQPNWLHKQLRKTGRTQLTD